MSAEGESHSHGPLRSGAVRMPKSVQIYDTTLRDGSQQEGLSLSVDDKLRVAAQLDHLGVHFIEGGWPGANPKDDEFFARAAKELNLTHAELVAFGSTRRAGTKAPEDKTLARLLEAGTSTVCIVAKAWDYHVDQALRTTLDEAVAMAADSVSYLVSQGRRVILDAEHFFDGYRSNPAFALDLLRAAHSAGAETLVLCDTNGGSLPDHVQEVVAAVTERLEAPIGVHLHNDSGCAVASSLAAVRAGAVHVQGCVNGYGERTGNADLVPIIAGLSLKIGVRTIPTERMERLTAAAHHIAEVVNVAPSPQQPYVGSSAFTHKAGLHVSAIARRRDAYEHLSPELVGNGARFVVSELAGRSTIAMKASELGLSLDDSAVTRALDHLKELEHAGYHFEAADGSLELLLRRSGGWEQPFFRVESFRVTSEHNGRLLSGEPGSRRAASRARPTPGSGLLTEATLRVWVGTERFLTVAEGAGPVHALDAALRQALAPSYPELDAMRLTDYRVRVLESSRGTAATTRVLLDCTNGTDSWSTIGVSDNVIEASWQALCDSMVLALVRTRGAASGDGGEEIPEEPLLGHHHEGGARA